MAFKFHKAAFTYLQQVLPFEIAKFIPKTNNIVIDDHFKLLNYAGFYIMTGYYQLIE